MCQEHFDNENDTNPNPIPDCSNDLIYGQDPQHFLMSLIGNWMVDPDTGNTVPSHQVLAKSNDQQFRAVSAKTLAFKGGDKVTVNTDAIGAQANTVRSILGQLLFPFVNLNFEFTSNANAAYTMVPIDGGTSYAGPVGGNVVKIQYGNYSPNIVLHEFSHACGLWHEGQSPTRPDDFFNKDALYQQYSFWGKANVDQWILTKMSASEVNSTPFDPESIMMYSFGAATNKLGKDIGPIGQLSTMDKQWYAQTYGTPKAGTMLPMSITPAILSTKQMNGTAKTTSAKPYTFPKIVVNRALGTANKPATSNGDQVWSIVFIMLAIIAITVAILYMKYK